jgi:hypothetical protein
MKYSKFSVLFLLVSACTGQTIPDSLRYLGLKPPGNEPKKFDLPVTPGYFAAERIAISSDGKEIYFGELTGYGPDSKGRLRYMKLSENRWNGPFTVIERAGNMALSIDGTKLFVGAEWYCERKDSGWGSPRRFWNTTNKLDYIQETHSGTYYTFSHPSGDTTRREWCRLTCTQTDTTVESLGTPPNVPDSGMDFYIARDESYIIIVVRRSPLRTTSGYADLYISFRRSDKTWTNPKSLGPAVNSADPDDGRWGPYVTDDNRFLFYSHGKDAATAGILWVRFDGLLDNLREAQ